MSILSKIFGDKQPADPVAAISAKLSELHDKRDTIAAGLVTLEEKAQAAAIEAALDSRKTADLDQAEKAVSDARRAIAGLDKLISELEAELATARQVAAEARAAAAEAAERDQAKAVLKSLPKLEARAKAALREIVTVARELNLAGGGGDRLLTMAGRYEAEGFEIPANVADDLERKVNPPESPLANWKRPAPVQHEAVTPLMFYDSGAKEWRDNPAARRPEKIQIVRGQPDSVFERLGRAVSA